MNECMHSVGINACHILCLHFFSRKWKANKCSKHETRNNMNIELIPQTVSLTLFYFLCMFFWYLQKNKEKPEKPHPSDIKFKFRMWSEEVAGEHEIYATMPRFQLHFITRESRSLELDIEEFFQVVLTQPSRLTHLFKY